MDTKQFLSGVHAVILEQGLGKARAQILAKQLENHGGKAEKVLSRKTTHILIGKTTRLSRIPNLLKIKCIPEKVLVLRADWLSACLVEAEKIGHDVYVVHTEPSPTTTTSPSKDKTSPTKVSPSASPSGVNTPPKQTASPSHSLKQSKFLTPPDEEAEERKIEESSSKLPTTPTRPAVSLTSPKVTWW